MRARFRENVRSDEDLKKISFSPSCASKEKRRHKKMHLGSQSIFFLLVAAQKFLVFRSAPLWKKEAKRHETRTVNIRELSSLCCCSRAKKRRDTFMKGFGESCCC